MHYLGIPTTRAASLIVSDKTRATRDPLYSGNVIQERCAVVMRVAPTFIRFGTFEVFLPQDEQTGRAGPSHGLQDEMMPKMLDYTINTFFPHIDQKL